MSVQESESDMFIIERKRLNIWNIGGFIVLIAVTAFGWGITFSTLLNSIDRTNERIDRLETKTSQIERVVPSVTQLEYSRDRFAELILQNTGGNNATNNRVDNLIENFATKLDNLTVNVNGLATQVQVLSTQMKERQP